MFPGLVLLASGLALATAQQQGGGSGQGGGPYVFDLLATPLNAAEVTALFESAVPGETFPIYNEPPKTQFSCKGKLGYYADPAAGCQAFQRCTLGGDQVTYLCPNGTLFNQLVLVCDWWFNVDCSKAESFYNFANPRIYNGPGSFLHDTPPKDYIAPWQRKQLAIFNQIIQDQQRQFAQINERLASSTGGQGGAAGGQQQQQQQQPEYSASASQPQAQQTMVEAQQPQQAQQQSDATDQQSSGSNQQQHSAPQERAASGSSSSNKGQNRQVVKSSNSNSFRSSSSSSKKSSSNNQQQ